MYQSIVSAVAAGDTITLGYLKPNEVLTVRLFKPYAIERCKNGNTIVRGMCPHDGHPKSLTLDSILAARKGDCIAAVSLALFASFSA